MFEFGDERIDLNDPLFPVDDCLGDDDENRVYLGDGVWTLNTSARPAEMPEISSDQKVHGSIDAL